MKYSIVPEILNSNKIKFLDENNIEVSICKKSPFKYISPFEPSYIIIDTFASKTARPTELVNIEIDELKKLGFMITAIEAGRNRWFHSQRVIYRIESISSPSPNSKRIKIIPKHHKIQMDKANENRIRLVGLNAGWPRRGNGGPWLELKK